MRRAVLAILVLVFVLGLAGTALAAPPTNIGADGSAVFTYQDLHDSAAKPEGGYAVFDVIGTGTQNVFNSATDTMTASTTADLYASNGGRGPHGGYSASSNKCKVCHAVHRAEGAYYLLRADSQSDACNYCHIGGSAHSSKVVYDLNPAGTATPNGHTLGAGEVPDSSIKQTTTPVTISGTDVNGATISDTVNVRSYDPAPIGLYRFSRHHAQSPAGTGRSGFKPVGPNSLSCFSCHQPHGAPAEEWQPAGFSATFADPATQTANTQGYKLLRRFPSGSWRGTNGVLDGTLNTYGFADITNVIKVPEATLTAGVNYSTVASFNATYSENGVWRQPTWVAQDIRGEVVASGGASGPSQDPATVNQYTLSVWCADCHNLNIGGDEGLTNEELGFKAHTERTHPAPYIGSHYGPGQCYSCHRNDLSVSPGVADPVGYGMNQPKPVGSTTDTCGQCHYGTLAYSQDVANTSARESDFPHSGKNSDMKLLGSYTANVASATANYTPVFSFATITETNLDAVCIRCHPGIGVHN